MIFINLIKNKKIKKDYNFRKKNKVNEKNKRSPFLKLFF